MTKYSRPIVRKKGTVDGKQYKATFEGNHCVRLSQFIKAGAGHWRLADMRGAKGQKAVAFLRDHGEITHG